MSSTDFLAELMQHATQPAAKVDAFSLADALIEPHLAPSASVADWRKGSSITEMFSSRQGRPPVEMTLELKRVLDLKRRPPVDIEGPEGVALAESVTRKYTRGPRACACASTPLGKLGHPCITALNPVQAWSLVEAPLAGGLLAPIGVGHGKTGLDFMMSLAMGSKLTVLLLPPGLVSGLIDAYLLWREHFHVPGLVTPERSFVVAGRPTVHVVPFSKFSRAESTALLENLKPDLIVVDEAHRLKNKDTATTARVLRYFVNHPETRLCVWSGTFTTRSIKEYAHLSGLSLREGSPLPNDPAVVEEWSVAIDPSAYPGPAGELRKFCKTDETLYDGFHRRLVETLGVVSTKSGAVGASIIFNERVAPPIPSKLALMLDVLRASETRPDGEEFVEAVQVVACARQLACGFYYRWKFPRGEPEQLILEWFEKRKQWNKELRQKLKLREEGLDSPRLCELASMRAHGQLASSGPEWKSDTWCEWFAICDKVQPESEAVWVDDYLASDAAQWANKNRGIVWYEHEAFGARVAQLAGLAMHGGGPGAPERIAAESGKRSIIASIKSHGTGRDGLQRKFNEQLVANQPSSGDAWEQLLGRLHRIGQSADEVITSIYRHTPEMIGALDTAMNQAFYIEKTMGTRQKLLVASCSFAH